MTAAILIVEDSISFTLDRANYDGSWPYKRSLEDCYTPYGFCTSILRAPDEALELLEGRAIEGASASTDSPFIVLTAEGRLYRFQRSGDRYIKLRIPYGKGSYAVQSPDTSIAQALSMALELTNLDVKRSLALVGKDILIRPETYMTFRIPDIMSELKKRGCTKEMALIKPFGAGAVVDK
jgi:hypothetical protein